jgi:hypothetical protein
MPREPLPADNGKHTLTPLTPPHQARAIELPIRGRIGSPKSHDRVQRGGRHQVAAVQCRPIAKRFRLRDGRGERLATVVAVGNDADFQATPSGILYPMPYYVLVAA